MQWTDRTPTVPGYCWYRHGKRRGTMCELWQDRTTGKLYRLTIDGGPHVMCPADYCSCEWAGPIPEPAEQ